MRRICVAVLLTWTLPGMIAAVADDGIATINVDFGAPRASVGPVSGELIGVNLPVHTDMRHVELSAVSEPGGNGVYEALRELNIGFIRQWSPAPECGIETISLPAHEPATDGDWESWFRAQLAPDSAHWVEFDRYIMRLSELGDDVHVMLCLPTFPVWLGPFRWADHYNGTLLDTRTGNTVAYDEFMRWAGIDKNCIGDIDRFEAFRGRVRLYVQLLVEHILSRPELRSTIRSIEVGNEPDNGGEVIQNTTRWRMFVYAMGSKERREQGELLPTDQGLLQKVYLAIRDGLKAGDPEGTLLLTGPSCAWAHNQKESAGAFYYLDYFIHGAQGIEGIGADNLDALTYHNYGHTYRHDAVTAALFEAYRRPIYLTEYNATAAGHGMNFMQTGATTVANVFAQLAQSANVRGAAFFKAAGGGFGLLLNRDGVLWRTGAYWTLKALGEWFVGGQPVAWALQSGAEADINCLAVRSGVEPVTHALMLVNLTDGPRQVRLELGAQPQDAEGRLIALPIAAERDDYRNVRESEIRHDFFPELPGTLLMPPRGVLLLRWQPQMPDGG